MIASVTEVEDLDGEGMTVYRTLRRNDEHNRTGIFVAEGNKVVLRLFTSDCTMVSILLTAEWFGRCRGDLECRPEPIRVFIAPDKLIKTIVGFNYHQGVIAVAKIPLSRQLATLPVVRGDRALIVAFDELNNAENVGAIVRNAAACGVDALITSRTSSDPYLRRSVRNSMGSIFKIPLVYTDDLAATLRQLRTEHGFTTVAAHLGEESVSLHSLDFTRKTCVVLGNEHCGITPAVLEECSTAMMVPMERDSIVDSFNVACASAIILHEAFRQRSLAL